MGKGGRPRVGHGGAPGEEGGRPGRTHEILEEEINTDHAMGAQLDRFVVETFDGWQLGPRHAEFVVEHAHRLAGKARVLAQVKIAARGDAFHSCVPNGNLNKMSTQARA